MVTCHTTMHGHMAHNIAHTSHTIFIHSYILSFQCAYKSVLTFFHSYNISNEPRHGSSCLGFAYAVVRYSTIFNLFIYLGRNAMPPAHPTKRPPPPLCPLRRTPRDTPLEYVIEIPELITTSTTHTTTTTSTSLATNIMPPICATSTTT